MANQRHKAYPIVIRDLEVKDAYDVTPLMRRVVLTGEQLDAFRNGDIEVGPFVSENADDHVKILVLDPERPEVVPPTQVDGTLDWNKETLLRTRDYTPRRYDVASRVLELDFVRHDNGVAAGWAETTRPGDRIHVAGPRGTTVLPDGIDWYLLIGDETALPAIARRVEELPAGTPVTAVISIASMSEAQEWDHACDLDLTWVPRDTTAPGDLQRAVEAAKWRDGQVYAWAAGEAGMLRPVRAWFKERGVPREFIDVAGYWRQGQRQGELAEAMHDVQHQSDLAVPYALRAAVTLGLAERVLDGSTTVDTLARDAGVRVRPLRKLLGVLASEGWFELADDDKVSVTTRGQVLAEDIVHSRLDHAYGYARLDDAWPGLLHTLGTGESGYRAVRGRSFWDELESDPTLSSTFDESLAQWAANWVPAAVAALAVDVEHVVDVGGGTGRLLAGVLAGSPGARGTLVERPATATLARAMFAREGVSARTTVAEQSMFDPLPEGHLVILAQVLHDWPDTDATALLRRAAEAGGRVAVIERLSGPEQDDHALAHDLTMTVVFGSGERTRGEYADLARAAGLEETALHDLGGELALIEYVRR